MNNAKLLQFIISRVVYTAAYSTFPSQQQHCQIACQIKCQNITVKNWIINICAFTGWKMTQNDESCEWIIRIGGDSFFLFFGVCRLQCDWYMEWSTIEYLLQKSKYGLNNLNTLLFICRRTHLTACATQSKWY